MIAPLATGWAVIVLIQALRFVEVGVAPLPTLGLACLAAAVVGLWKWGIRHLAENHPYLLYRIAGCAALTALLMLFWTSGPVLIEWLRGRAKFSTYSSSWWNFYAGSHLPLVVRTLLILAAIMVFVRYILRCNWGAAVLTSLGVATIALLLLRGDRFERFAAPAFLCWLFLTGHTGVFVIRLILRIEVSWPIGALAIYAILGLLLLGLGHLGLVKPSILSGMVAIAAGPGLVRFIYDRKTLWDTLRGWGKTQGPAEAAYFAGLWICAAVAYINATAPETGFDAVNYHIPFTTRLIREGTLLPEPLHWAHLMPQWSQTFFGLGYGTIGEVGAKWLAWSASLCLGFTLYGELRRLGAAQRLALAATLLFSGSPFLVLWSSTCYYDLTLTAMVLAGVSCLRRAIVEPGQAWGAGALAALFLGTCLSLKYTTLMFGAILFPAAMIGFSAPWRCKLTVLCLVALGSLLVAFPWYLTVYRWTGNPIFPFFNHYFRSPYWPANYDIRHLYEGAFGYKSSIDYLMLPWRITFQTSAAAEEPDGALGVSLLLFIPLIAWVRGRLALSYLGLAAAFIAMTGLTTVYVRYWFPVLPFIVIALALTCSRLQPDRWRCITGLGRLMTASLLVLLTLVQLPLGLRGNYGVPGGVAWAYYLGKEDRDSFLARDNLPAADFRGLASEMLPGESVFCADYYGKSIIPARCYGLVSWQQRLMGQDHWEWYETQLREKHARFLATTARLAPGGPGNGPSETVEEFYRQRGWGPLLRPDRLICTCGTVRLYDLKADRWTPDRLLEKTAIGPRVFPSEGSSVISAALPTSDAFTQMSPLTEELVVPGEARRARIMIETRSENKATALMDVIWLGSNGGVLKWELVELSLAAGRPSQMMYAGQVPACASRVKLNLRPYPTGKLLLSSGTMEFSR